MRSLEYLIQLFPDKTGRELLEIQEQDKKEAELKTQEEDKENLSIIEDIQKNGGYYRGAFGTSQYYMYKILKIELIDKNIYCDCEKIVLFDSQNIKNGTIGENEIRFEITKKDYIKFGDITLLSKRITEKEYEHLKSHLFGVVPTFFPSEWSLCQKEFGNKK